jgi:formylglycine-generating enzyme required for sulfatase activity
MKKIFIISILLLQTVWMSAQTITGKLVDQNGNGLSDLHLQLYITPNVYNTTSDADGSFTFTDITSVEVEGESLPTGYAISNNYPNPFNPTTRIGITLPNAGKVRIDIYNLLGQKVMKEKERHFNAGYNYIDLELNGFPNGFYIARITIDEKYTVTKKMMLIYGSQHLSSPNFNSIPNFKLNKNSKSLVTIIDSLVVTGSSIARKVFSNLPNLVGTSLDLGNLIITISQDLVQVTGGTFTAGSTPVTISSFNIDKYEVTYELWTEVRTWALTHGYTDLPTGRNGYNPVGTNNPVTEVNWYDIVKWCNARSEKDGLTPVYYTDNTQANIYRTGQLDLASDAVKWNTNGYRLPTEAEWEFAARGGTSSHGYTYSGSNTIDNVAWYPSNSGNTTHTVGTKSANEPGIYDMSGNVWEWCWDKYGAYSSSAQIDPKGATSGTNRVLRGGSFYSDEVSCPVDNHGDYGYVVPSDRYGDYGFRCVQD